MLKLLAIRVGQCGNTDLRPVLSNWKDSGLEANNKNIIPCESKKQDTLLLPITLLNIEIFKILSPADSAMIPNGMITKDSTRRYTTL